MLQSKGEGGKNSEGEKIKKKKKTYLENFPFAYGDERMARLDVGNMCRLVY